MSPTVCEGQLLSTVVLVEMGSDNVLIIMASFVPSGF